MMGRIADHAAVLATGAVLLFLSSRYPAHLPAWAPWDFSAPEFLGTALPLLWYCRGVAREPAEGRPSFWRAFAFLAGLAAVYGVLQTRYDYWAQHMFFLNRIQHVAMHHIGPFLMVLGRPGKAIRAGMPAPVRAVLESRAVALAMRILQQPLVAALLFSGLFVLWLVPPVHFRAMLDPRLYALMNWSMVVDGLLFWSLVLDPRPRPPARISFGMRGIICVLVIFPQIVAGAIITFSSRELYPFYDLCGRLFPSVAPMDDQGIGGIVTWIPPAMMSVIGLLLVINAVRLQEEKRPDRTAREAALAAAARGWTGR